MRLRRGLAAAALACASGLAAPAEAQHFEGRGSLTAAATYNQTITDTPSSVSPVAAGPSLSLSPQVALVYETPRTDNILSYAFTLNVPFMRGIESSVGPVSYGNRFAYSGRYELSELSSLSFALALNHGPAQVLAVAADASQTQLDPLPASTTYVLGVSAQEGFTRQLSQVLSLTQANAFTLIDPIDPVRAQSRTFGVQNSFSLDRTFSVDTLGGQIAVATSYFTAGGAVIEPRLQVASTAALTWSRQISASLTSTLTAGVTYLASPGKAAPGMVQPTGTLSLTYRLEPAVIMFAYAHQAAPNLAAGAVTFTDSATLRLSAPIARLGLIAAGSAGFAHMEPTGDMAGAATNVFLADASLTYRPSAAPILALGLRGQVQRQLGGLEPDYGLTRLAASLNVTVSYPSAGAAMVTPSMPPAFGGASFAPSAGSMASEPVEVPAEQEP